MSTNIKPNANFHSLSNTSVHDNMSPKYLEYRRKWIDNPKQMILEKFPLHLDIESTNLCNLRCTFCDKQSNIEKDGFGRMDFGLYKNIIDEAKQFGLYSIKLSYRGEPLLHPKIFDMITYAKESGVIDIYFNTNGMPLSDYTIDRLIDSGINRISVSVEGTDPIAFEEARVGASFDKIKENLVKLLAKRKERNSEYPKIRIQTVLLPGIDMEEYKTYWESFGDEVAAIDYKDENQVKPGKVAKDWACPQLWQRMTIGWDGTIFMCNNDDHNRIKLGNVANQTIYGNWNGTTMNEIRDKHKNGLSHCVHACNECPWRTAQLTKLGGTI
ncbi:hypothetical protein BHU72_05270 [Desulfuribacillus stibiiarsenatis]|uniref:Radical SAM core domain-containing protein n=1 Tax=Desulfuribacillus stibiiarsenatis TaxID=1390249 RepID=A0A1E5L5S4_9FIRM|nr:radical SAM/SPASM domain-containing protein [Desulfuribacillus stibiiarsenatis]OEH85497.1 hypothetical protein BHU72_05270 [Desulfuribacillus stibiiarsenatis]